MTEKTILELIGLMAQFQVTGAETIKEIGKCGAVICGTKTSGKLRRLSLDITRKLAELRAGK